MMQETTQTIHSAFIPELPASTTRAMFESDRGEEQVNTKIYRLESPSTVVREAITAHLEVLLGRLRGEGLLIAALSYGLGVRMSHLREVRMRDVSISENTVVVAGRERLIPEGILEDLRDHVQERMCGREASVNLSRREQRLFSDDAFELFAQESRHVDAMFGEKLRVSVGQRARACLDSRLRILGWFHRKRAARKGIKFSSALDLLDKGPRIVRRRGAGSVDAYYLWRASRVLFS
jgi:hypothetical protein